MSIHRRAAKRDSAEPAIIEALRAAGASVVQLSDSGLPDLLIGWRNVTILAEVKSKTGKLTRAQETFLSQWKGAPVAILRTIEDVHALLRSLLDVDESLPDLQ